MSRSAVATELLTAHIEGRKEASEKLFVLVYDELRNLARNLLKRERKGHTLQPTALVHEAYLRLLGDGLKPWEDMAHFKAVAAVVLRRVLVDSARARSARKRGSDQANQPGLEEAVTLVDDGSGRTLDLMALDDAIERLSRSSKRTSEVVQLRFFGGLTTEETAQALKISSRVVQREWAFARVWLSQELDPPPESPSLETDEPAP